jgi:N-methylhydantoinase A/oxoprolinase/acetone carboxylase beta subunit
MNIALGIDTGGTFTDAVLVDHTTGQVLAGAKSLTTRHNLAIGIAGAITDVFAAAAQAGQTAAAGDITLVALSTTLATNSLAEGQRGTVCLILIGYDPELLDSFGFIDELATEDVVYLRGGHNALGDEVAPLDEEAARAAILARKHSVEAFAVSGYFGVRNPAHENRVRALVDELAGLPVTCGHELTSRLDSVRRATTVALNAHLILPLRELILSVDKTLRSQGITAPLMVVKGDGSLVRADWAVRRPIETILSGPAASVVGAWHLSGRRDMWVVDVGGTTTDIAALRDALPILNDDGASVAGWRTMIEAVDVHTTGLGGDSRVRMDAEGKLHIGPRRVIPLSLLAHEHPQIVAHLRRMASLPPDRRPEEASEFVVAGRQPEMTLSDEEQELVQQAAAGPQAVAVLTQEVKRGWMVGRRIRELEARGLVRRAGFTPTDALHVLGRFTRWNGEAARLGATLMAADHGLTAADLCRQVVSAFSKKVSAELVSKILEDEARKPDWEQDLAGNILLNRALGGSDGLDLSCTLTLHRPLVAIGAPVAAYMPDVAGHLHTELVIPPHADVANAVGAVAGGIVQRLRVLINPLEDDGRLRVHLPDGVSDFDSLGDAVRHAEDRVYPLVEEMARQAGAEHIEVHMARRDHRAPTARGGGEEVYLGTELTFTAAGRPSLARR